jgi:hypothetical protein
MCVSHSIAVGRTASACGTGGDESTGSRQGYAYMSDESPRQPRQNRNKSVTCARPCALTLQVGPVEYHVRAHIYRCNLSSFPSEETCPGQWYHRQCSVSEKQELVGQP